MELPEELLAAAQKHGDVPILQRTIFSPPNRVRTLQRLQGGLLGAAGLVWNHRGQVLLVREPATEEGREIWTTPGGEARPGEDPEDAFRREVKEEAGVQAEILDLTYVFDLTVTDGEGEVRGFFFQYEGMAQDTTTRPGRRVLEVGWFDELPRDMAFRDDYEPLVERRRANFHDK